MSYRRIGITLVLMFAVLLGGELGYRRFVADDSTDNPTIFATGSREVPGGQFQPDPGIRVQPLSVEANRLRPLPPLNTTVAHRAPGEVQLAWDKGAPEHSYQVAYWHVGDTRAEWIILPEAGIQVDMDSNTGAVISNLSEHPELVHHFAVRAVTGEDQSAWTDTISTAAFLSQPQETAARLQTSVLSVIDNQNLFGQSPIGKVVIRLSVPQELTGRYESGEVIALDWKAVPGASAYQVRVWDDDNVDWSILPNEKFQISWDGPKAVVRSSLPDGFGSPTEEKIWFSIKAVAEEGSSLWSKPVPIKLSLEAPVGLFGRLSGDNGVRLDWQDVPLADFYEVRFRSSAYANTEWIILSDATAISVTMAGSGTVSISLIWVAGWQGTRGPR